MWIRLLPCKLFHQSQVLLVSIEGQILPRVLWRLIVPLIFTIFACTLLTEELIENENYFR